MNTHFYLYVILFIPSLVFGLSFLNEINYVKTFTSYFLTILVSLFIFIRHISRNKKSAVIFSSLDIFACVFFLSCVILMEITDLLPITTIYIYYIACSVFLKSVLHSDTSKINNLKHITLITSVVVCIHIVLAFFQKLVIAPSFNNYFTGGSTFGNPDMLGSYLAFLTPFCFYSDRKVFRYEYIVVFFTIILLIAIQARTALLSLFLCLLLWVYLNKKVQSKIFFLLLIGLSLLLIVGLIYWNPISVYGRIFVWYICIMMILRKPLGWGEFAFSKHFNEFQAEYLSENSHLYSNISFDVVHSPFNEFLFLGVRFGVIPMLIYVILVITIFWFVIKRNNRLVYPLLVFLIVSFAYFPFKITPLLILVIPVATLVSVQSRSVIKLFIPGVIKRLGVGLLLIISSILLIYHTKEFLEFKKWQKAVIYFKEKNRTSESKKLFNELYPKMKTDGRFLITFSNLKYIQDDKKEAIKLLEQADNYFCDIVLSVKMAKLYYELGNYEKAEEKFILAENIAPDRFSTSYDRVLFYIDTHQNIKAYELCKDILNRPVKKQIYADPYIIKSKVRKIILAYENGESISTFGNTQYNKKR